MSDAGAISGGKEQKMNLQEVNSRLKKVGPITEEQLQDITPAYFALDFDKDIFCKMVDAVGPQIFIDYKPSFERLLLAYEQFLAKEKYFSDKNQLDWHQGQIQSLQASIAAYEKSDLFL
jgi:hypothetical protein